MMTIPEVARFLKISIRSVYRLIESRQLIARKFGRSRRVAEADLHRMIQRSSGWSHNVTQTED